MIHTNPDDLWAAMQQIRMEIGQLQRSAGLGSSSIDRGSLRVNVDSGIDVSDAGSVTAGQATLDGGSGGRVGAGGTWVRSDGSLWNDGNELNVASNTEFAGNVTAQGAVRGHQGVIAPIGGVMTQLGPAISTAQSTANSAASAASAAQSTANTALSTANGKTAQTAHDALMARVADLESQVGSLSSLYGTLANAHNDLKASYELHLAEFHGGWPNGN